MSRTRKPFCQGCGSGRCHVVTLTGGALIWLCGSCETLRGNPNAQKRKVPEGLPADWPKGRKGKPQKESLF